MRVDDITVFSRPRPNDGIHLHSLKEACRELAENINETEQKIADANRTIEQCRFAGERMRKDYLVLRAEILRLSPGDDGYNRHYVRWVEDRDCDRNGVFVAGSAT